MTVRRWLKRVVIAASAAAVVGCAGTPAKVDAPGQQQQVFFPAEPAPPRLQFLTSLATASSWSTGPQKSSFAQWIAGEEPSTGAPDRIDIPYGVDAYHGKLYICDVGRDCIHVVDAATGRFNLLESGGAMKNPVNITIDRRDGTKFVCDTGRNMVLVFDAGDQLVAELGDPATLSPMDLAIDGQELYIVDAIDSEIEIWSRSGQKLRAFGRKGRGPDELDGPSNLAIGPDNRIYVTDTMSAQVKIFDRQGQFQGSIGQPGTAIGSFARPKGIAIDPHGHVYVSDAQWRVVQVFTGNDDLLLIISGMGGKAPGIVVPAAVAIDRTSLPAFQKHLDPDFEAEYLLLLVNQYGRNKVSVYAYGKSKSRPASDYQTEP